jgi:hypothetical protein
MTSSAMRIWKQAKRGRRGQITGQEKQEVKNLHIAHTASGGSTPHGGSQNRSRGRFLQHTVNQAKTKRDEKNAADRAHHLNVVVDA